MLLHCKIDIITFFLPKISRDLRGHQSEKSNTKTLQAEYKICLACFIAIYCSYNKSQCNILARMPIYNIAEHIMWIIESQSM